jgi:hypothetical protein
MKSNCSGIDLSQSLPPEINSNLTPRTGHIGTNVVPVAATVPAKLYMGSPHFNTALNNIVFLSQRLRLKLFFHTLKLILTENQILI